MFLYQLVNLVLETCFIFSKTLKLSKTFSSWISRFVLSFEQRALWLPYSRLSFGIVFKRMLILECLGCFTKSIVVSILDFWHISFRKMFEWMTCKMRIITFESRATYRECLLFKRLSWHGKSVGCYQTFYFSRRGLQLFLLGRHVDWKFNHMDRLKPVGFWKPTSWAPCRTIRNRFHGCVWDVV